MSFDIYALVPAEHWPTARQLDDALVSEGFPARLADRPAAAWVAPLAPVDGEPLRTVVQDPEHAKVLGVQVGHEFVTPMEQIMPVILGDICRDPDFGIETLSDPKELNEELHDLGAPITAQVSDKLVWFSHHVDQWNYNAAVYVLATLIRNFHAYGFEFQGMTHGSAAFASELLDSLYADPQSDPLGLQS